MTAVSRREATRRRRPRQAGGLTLVLLSAAILTGCSSSPTPEPRSLKDPGCASPAETQQANTLTAELTKQLDGVGMWSQTWSDPPIAAQLSHPAALPAGVDPSTILSKMPIFLAPGVDGTVSILAPASARPFATTWPRWKNLSGRDLLTQQTTAVTLHGCEGIGSYPAMMVLQKATCVTLRLAVDGKAPTDITVPFFGATC
jgi:hypothetical protein